jgi:glycosyltransferase involved in cell wall biosynthesis
MKVAIIHYWLVSWRGGEQALQALCELFPQADVYTHVLDPGILSPTLQRQHIHTTFINRLPAARRFYKHYLPLMPLALEQLDLQAYDLVISIESGPAKGVIVRPDALHICYCLTPMRYLWDKYPEYLANAGRLTRWLMPWPLHRLRQWDRLAADRVDHFIAISRFVARRIEKYYRRSAEVIYPPVATERWQLDVPPAREPFYLVAGQLVAYKRVELAIEACNRLQRRLIIIGEGEQQHQLQRLAGPTVTLLGRQPDAVLRDHYARCRALLFPGVEDFGLVPVEAMAAGAPVIALRAGGALETVVEGQTGWFFDQPSDAALADAMVAFEQHAAPDATVLRQHAAQFATDQFKQRMAAAVQRYLEQHEAQ